MTTTARPGARQLLALIILFRTVCAARSYCRQAASYGDILHITIGRLSGDRIDHHLQLRIIDHFGQANWNGIANELSRQERL